MIQERTVYKGHDPYYLVCEPFYRKAADGEHFILFQSGGHTEPANNNTLFITHSRDKGASWTEPREIFRTEGKGTWCSETFVDADKITAFIYEVEAARHFATLRAFRSYSYDGGYTWTSRDLFVPYHECCNMRQRIIRSDGAWVIPFCYTKAVTRSEKIDLPLRESKNKQWNDLYQNHIYRSGVLISQNQGQSFSRHHVPADPQLGFLWEPNCVELSDGRIVILMRHEYDGWLWWSQSSDGGITWSKAARMDIPDAAVKMRLLKLNDGRIILFCHPNQQLRNNNDWVRENSRKARYPLEMWISDDDMQSWRKKVNLQDITPARISTEKNDQKHVQDYPGTNADKIDLYHYPDGYVDEDDRKIYIAVDLNRNELVTFEIPFIDLVC